jgi:hypothetical protein
MARHTEIEFRWGAGLGSTQDDDDASLIDSFSSSTRYSWIAGIKYLTRIRVHAIYNGLIRRGDDLGINVTTSTRGSKSEHDDPPQSSVHARVSQISLVSLSCHAQDHAGCSFKRLGAHQQSHVMMGSMLCSLRAPTRSPATRRPMRSTSLR